MEEFIRFFMRKSSASKVSLLFNKCHIKKKTVESKVFDFRPKKPEFFVR